MVESRDAQIGASVARLRGTMSQSELAERMKARGWKWSQSTVWSVEKGSRPLKYAEAVDLCTILDAELGDLLPTSQSADAVNLVRSWTTAQREIETAASVLSNLLAYVDFFATQHEAHPELAADLWGRDGGEDWEAWVKWAASSSPRMAKPQPVIPSTPERYAALLRAADAVARSVLIDPGDKHGERQAEA